MKALSILLLAASVQAAFVSAGRRGGDGVLCSLEEGGALLRGCGTWLEAWSGLEDEPVLEARFDLEEPVVDLARLPGGPVVALTRDGTLLGYDWDGAAPEEIWRLEAADLDCAQRLEPWNGELLVCGEWNGGQLRFNGAEPELVTDGPLQNAHDAFVLGDTLLVDRGFRCFPSWCVYSDWDGYSWTGESWEILDHDSIFLLGLGFMDANAVDGERAVLTDGSSLTMLDRADIGAPQQGTAEGLWGDGIHSAVALSGERLLVGGEGLALLSLADWPASPLPVDWRSASAVDAIHVTGTIARVDHANATDWLEFGSDAFEPLLELPNAARAESVVLADSLVAFAGAALELHRFVDDELQLAWAGARPCAGDLRWDGDRLVFVDSGSGRVGWLDCADPAAPQPLGEADFAGLLDAKPWNGRLAVLREDGVAVYDTGDPANPQPLFAAPLTGALALEGQGPTLGVRQPDGTLRALQLDDDPPWMGQPLPEPLPASTRVVSLRDRLLTLRNEQIAGDWGQVIVQVWNTGLAQPALDFETGIDSRYLIDASASAGRLLLLMRDWTPIDVYDNQLGALRLVEGVGLQPLGTRTLPFDAEGLVVGGARAAVHRPDRGWTFFHEDSEVAVETAPARPAALALAAAPNPFNPSCSIAFELARPGEVDLAVYNLLGERVATLQAGRLPAGSYRRTFDGAVLPSGLYFARLEAGGRSRVVKLTLLR